MLLAEPFLRFISWLKHQYVASRFCIGALVKATQNSYESCKY